MSYYNSWEHLVSELRLSDKRYLLLDGFAGGGGGGEVKGLAAGVGVDADASLNPSGGDAELTVLLGLYASSFGLLFLQPMMRRFL